MNSAPVSVPAAAAALVEAMGALVAEGLTRGTAGNASVRIAEGFLVTPSGVRPRDLSAERMVRVALDGTVLDAGRPSSEWRFHRDIYRGRAEVGAIVHVHSPAASALSCLRRDIPPFHYMIRVAGGDTLRCAAYATFGTQELSDHALAALAGRRACLLANHGQIALGRDLDQALALAGEVEGLAQQYLLALSAGEPVLLGEAEMRAVERQFEGYGSP